MRKYLLCLAMILGPSLNTYGLMLALGVEREVAVVAVFMGVGVVVAVGVGVSVGAVVGVVVAVFMGVGVVVAVGVAAGVFAGAVVAVAVGVGVGAVVGEELKLKARWCVLANEVVVLFLAAGLATENLIVVFGSLLTGLFLLRFIGDLPKAELETAKARAERRPNKAATV